MAMAQRKLIEPETTGRGRVRASAIDRHIGLRIRDRRVMLGLSQQQLADLIGVTYQQAHKYERGLNRVSAGRLYSIAQALGVEPGFFFEGLDGEPTEEVTGQRRALLELVRHFQSIVDPQRRQALASLVRSLAGEPAVGL